MKIENLNGMTEEEKIEKLEDWIYQLDHYSLFMTGITYLTIFNNEKITLYLSGKGTPVSILLYDKTNSIIWSRFISDFIEEYKLSIDAIWDYINKHCVPIIDEGENKYKRYLVDVEFLKSMDFEEFLKKIKKEYCILFKNEQIILGISQVNKSLPNFLQGFLEFLF